MQNQAPALAQRENFDRQQRASQWSENVIASAVNATGELVAVHYGWSRSGGTGTTSSERTNYKAQFQESERRGKRPDLLLFDSAAYRQLHTSYNGLIDHLEGAPNTPAVDAIARAAVAGIEAETSAWAAEQMPGFHKAPRVHFPGTKGTRLYEEPMFAASDVIPNIILKAKDIHALRSWQSWAHVPVFVVSVFPDMFAIGIRMDSAMELVRRGVIKTVTIKFDQNTESYVWKIWHTRCFRLPKVAAGQLQGWAKTASNGRVESGYIVVGGSIRIPPNFLAELRSGYRPENQLLANFLDAKLSSLLAPRKRGPR